MKYLLLMLAVATLLVTGGCILVPEGGDRGGYRGGGDHDGHYSGGDHGDYDGNHDEHH